MKGTADVVIIGGGVTGCSIAYHLAQKGCKDIAICEKDYVTSGSTGRCAGGVRQLWGHETNTMFAVESVKEFKVMHELFGRDVEYHQSGYITLALTEDDVKKYKKNTKIWQDRGVRVSYLLPEELKELSPHLDIHKIKGAIYSPTDGWANPFKVTQGYAEKAKNAGAKIYIHTEVNGIDVQNGRIRAVKTNHGEIKTRIVVNAAGGYSKKVCDMVGLDVPTSSERHQILVTEPMPPGLGPHINIFTPPFYIKQSKNGNLILGKGGSEAPSHSTKSTSKFMNEVAKFTSNLVPSLKDISVIRQWAGLYNLTPDQSQIMDKAKEIESFYMAIGFSGHGFMFAPAVGITMAELILENNTTIPIDNLSLDRYERNELIEEPMVN